MGSARKLGDERILAGSHSTYDSFTVFFVENTNLALILLLLLQVFTSDDSQNLDDDLGKQLQIINSFALLLLLPFY